MQQGERNGVVKTLAGRPDLRYSLDDGPGGVIRRGEEFESFENTGVDPHAVGKVPPVSMAMRSSEWDARAMKREDYHRLRDSITVN